jgi:NAD(P)-dependent dehydrogenase (short-subunit alcohol dehydrogenase family)
MKPSQWNAQSVPDLAGKTAIVTGATGGIGKETARVLAGKGANVILAVRNVEKGEQVADEFRRAPSKGKISVLALELGSLASIKAFAEKVMAAERRLDILVNNAGVMFPPYEKTEDGFELQFGANHLGHFALTGRLLPLLKATQGARVVTVSSTGHTGGNLDFSDLNWQSRKFDTIKAYCDSKLANLYFTYELARRLQEQGASLCVTASHPGMTDTDLKRHSGFLMRSIFIFAQNAEMGALPSLRAACDPDAKAGDFFGPDGFLGMRGFPVKVKSNARSHDKAAARKLWEISEELTGVSY